MTGSPRARLERAASHPGLDPEAAGLCVALVHELVAAAGAVAVAAAEARVAVG